MHMSAQLAFRPSTASVARPHAASGHARLPSTRPGVGKLHPCVDRPAGGHELPGSNPALPSGHHASRGRETNTACAQANDMLRAAKLPPARGYSDLMDLPALINYYGQPAGLGLRFPPNIDPLPNRGATPTVPLTPVHRSTTASSCPARGTSFRVRQASGS